MTPMPKKAKVFMQDKEKLLKLADVITCRKELDIRQKIDRTKTSASSNHVPSRQSGVPSASDKLRAAKELLVARKARQKREKARARKREEQKLNKDPGSHGGLVDHASPSTASRKRVSFV